MAKVYAGKYPGSNYSSYKAVPGQFSKNGTPKKAFKNKGMEWTYSGWGTAKPTGWKSKANKKSLVDWAGGKVNVYDYGDENSDEYIGFYNHDTDSNLYQERVAYAEHAFDTSRPDIGSIVDTEGCGHIEYLAYASKEQILLVSFQNGATCLFFRVPSVIASTLFHFAETKATAGVHTVGTKKGQPRHCLGVYFWDLIRIRGSQHGARYPFEYQAHTDGKVARHSNRHYVKITAENMPVIAGAVLGSKNGALAKLVENGALKQGDVLSVVLNDEEYAKYAKEVYLRRAEDLGMTGAYYTQEKKRVRDKDGNVREVEVSSDYVTNTVSGVSEKSMLMESVREEATQSIQNLQTSNYFSRELNKKKSQLAEGADADVYFEGSALEAKLTKQILNEDNPSLASGYNSRTGRLSSNPDVLIRAVKGPGYIREWEQENFPAHYAGKFTGRVWTVQQLKDFANPAIKGNISLAHAPKYKALIQNNDWEGALNFLKSNGTRQEYKNPKTNSVEYLGNVKYASAYDTWEE